VLSIAISQGHTACYFPDHLFTVLSAAIGQKRTARSFAHLSFTVLLAAIGQGHMASLYLIVSFWSNLLQESKSVVEIIVAIYNFVLLESWCWIKIFFCSGSKSKTTSEAEAKQVVASSQPRKVAPTHGVAPVLPAVKREASSAPAAATLVAKKPRLASQTFTPLGRSSEVERRGSPTTQVYLYEEIATEGKTRLSNNTGVSWGRNSLKVREGSPITQVYLDDTIATEGTSSLSNNTGQSENQSVFLVITSFSIIFMKRWATLRCSTVT